MNNLDTDSLIKAGRDIREPFILSVVHQDGSEGQLTVKKILRLLPGKRIVAVAADGEADYLVKIFVGKGSGRYVRREVAGAQSIEDAGVLTAGLEWQASMKSRGGHVLAFDFIDRAKNFIDVWDVAGTDAERTRLIGKVMPVLASLHEGGVVQNDIHPENFLFRDELIYTIDGGDVSSHGRGPLSEKRSLRNLALFFAQFSARHDHLVEGFMEQYRLSRAWTHDPARVARLNRLVEQERTRRKDDYIEKAYRECTRFSCRRTLTAFTVCERDYDSPEMRNLLAGLDERMAAGQMLKNGNTATVAVIEGPAGPLVVKRYNVKNFLHAASRAFRKSRAWVSWGNAYRLEFLGISSVKPVALVEERWWFLRRRAYFLTEYIEGPDASVLPEKENAQAAISSIAEILKEMSAAGVTHGDLKASNFLLGSDGPVIIDLDSMREHDDPAEKDRAEKRDLARFMKNWESLPDVRQQFAELLG